MNFTKVYSNVAVVADWGTFWTLAYILTMHGITLDFLRRAYTDIRYSTLNRVRILKYFGTASFSLSLNMIPVERLENPLLHLHIIVLIGEGILLLFFVAIYLYIMKKEPEQRFKDFNTTKIMHYRAKKKRR